MSNYIKRLYRWFVFPWPLHLLFVFIVIHLTGMVLFSENVDSWNLHSSTFLQLFGGWFVIKTINDNLGILSSSSIFQSVREYFRMLPSYKPKNITMHAEGASFGMSFGTGDLTLNKKLKSTKEKLEFLFSEIKRLEAEIRETREELSKTIDSLQSSVEASIRNQKNDIENIRGKLIDTLVGSAKEEALGILCIFYSLLIPYITLLMKYTFRV